jgi:ubiquinone/menaquinone biosynthesis C-methylase UbiE
VLLMGTGEQVETRGHIVGFREEIRKTADLSPDAFLRWFDHASSVDETFVRGAWDFSVHIAQPLAPYLRQPEHKTVLEVGHGAGRILASAARHFGAAVGIDVHDRNDIVGHELAGRGITNAKLLETDGRSIPLPDTSIDVVYTFIVLQHVERIAIFDGYVREIARVLKPGGLVMLYFGRWCHWSIGTRSRARYVADRIGERLLLRSGFREMQAPVNHTNLLVSIGHASRLARRAGFDVLGRVVSHRQVPDGTDLYGGQHGLVLRRR